MSEVKAGEIWRVKALGGFRYVLIVSPESMNQALPSLITVPITSKKKTWPTRVAIKFKNGIRFAQCEHLSIELKENLQKKMGQTSMPELAKIRVLLQQMLVES